MEEIKISGFINKDDTTYKFVVQEEKQNSGDCDGQGQSQPEEQVTPSVSGTPGNFVKIGSDGKSLEDSGKNPENFAPAVEGGYALSDHTHNEYLTEQDISGKADVGHTHTISDITDLEIDGEITQNSNNPVTNGAVYKILNEQSAINDALLSIITSTSYAKTIQDTRLEIRTLSNIIAKTLSNGIVILFFGWSSNGDTLFSIKNPTNIAISDKLYNLTAHWKDIEQAKPSTLLSVLEHCECETVGNMLIQ